MWILSWRRAAKSLSARLHEYLRERSQPRTSSLRSIQSSYDYAAFQEEGEKLERPQRLSHPLLDLDDIPPTLPPVPDAIDTFYFNGFGKDGFKIVLRLARRRERWAEVWVALQDGPDGVVMQVV